jgi:hypothetical protein
MGPGPFLGDTVHHNCSSLGFFLHQDTLHSCISKGRGKRIAGEYVDLANLLINSQATQLEGQKLVFLNGEIVVKQKSKNKMQYNLVQLPW